MPSKIQMFPDGRVESSAPARRELASTGSGKSIVQRVSTDFCLVVSGNANTQLLSAGQITSQMTVLEMLGMAANAGWTCELCLRSPHPSGGAERRLGIRQGVLEWATSSEDDDSLAEVLLTRGLVSAENIQLAKKAIPSAAALGTECLRTDLLDKNQLFEALQHQVRHIFFSALLLNQGTFAFTTSDETRPPPQVRVQMVIQGLLMEGVQRIDEMALFRQRISSTELVPLRAKEHPPVDLSGAALALWGAIDGQKSIAGLARAHGLDEFETIKIFYQFVQRGAVELRAEPKIDTTVVREMVSTFNDVLRDIFLAVATYGGLDETRATLMAWIEGSGYELTLGSVREDGTVDPTTVIASVTQAEASEQRTRDSGPQAPHAGAQRALHELVSFAMFAASTVLPKQQELRLARDVNRRLAAVANS